MGDFLELLSHHPIYVVLLVIGAILSAALLFEEYLGFRPRPQVRRVTGAIGLLLFAMGALLAWLASREIVLDGESVVRLDGVKLPVEGDATYVYGADTLLDRWDGDSLASPSAPRRSAEWRVESVRGGDYRVIVTYASLEPRPLRLLIDGAVILEKIATESTDGWSVDDRKDFAYGPVSIEGGGHRVTLETEAPGQAWPHFKELRLVPRLPW